MTTGSVWVSKLGLKSSGTNSVDESQVSYVWWERFSTRDLGRFISVPQSGSSQLPDKLTLCGFKGISPWTHEEVGGRCQTVLVPQFACWEEVSECIGDRSLHKADETLGALVLNKHAYSAIKAELPLCLVRLRPECSNPEKWEAF